MDPEKTRVIAPSILSLLNPTKFRATDSSATTPAEKETALTTDKEDVLPREKPLRPAASRTISTESFLDSESQEYRPKGQGYSNIRYTYLNTYRRLFTFVFAANLVAYVAVWCKNRKLLSFVDGAAANLLVCGLVRQPLVVNFFYSLACMIPRSAPVRLRTLAAKIFHFGGVHSGCGVACAVWYITFVGMLTYDYARNSIVGNSVSYTAVLVLAYLVMVLLCAIIIAAYPGIRRASHDWFEWVHRYSGWAAILSFWPLLLTFSSQQQPSMGIFLVQQPTFYILILITVSVIQPWAMLRKVKVISEKLSSHAVRLHFDFTSTKFGQGISISRHPLQDWHSFAGFPDKFDQPDSKFSLVVSRAGDFTGDLIDHPPTHIWKRSVPSYGFGKVMSLYSRIILVATGSGMGPCLSFLGDDDRPRLRLIWQTRTPQMTYGQRLIELIHRMDPEPVILDTTKGGRIDMLPLIIDLYKKFDAEAVCVISNPKQTKHLVFELERRGILAMGPIFDS